VENSLKLWDAPSTFYHGEGGNGISSSNDIGNPVISTDEEVTIVQRIDSYFNYANGYQTG